MYKVNEKLIIKKKINQGIMSAEHKFKKYPKYNIKEGCDIYLDIIEQISVSVGVYWVFDNIIDIIYIDNKKIDSKLLNILLNLIKSEVYQYGLKIIKDHNNNFIYLYMDKIFNNEIYYVDDFREKEKIENSIGRKY